MRHEPALYIMLFGILGLAVLAVVLLHREEKRQAKIWKFHSCGIYDSVAYGEYPVTKRSGAMVHTTRRVFMQTTAIYFTDGRTVVCDGRRPMPYPKGTMLYIYENGHGAKRIRDREEKSS